MNWGEFRKIFRGVAWKRLSSHEVDPRVSNGHEFQGVGQLRSLLGAEKQDEIPTTYVLLADSSESDIVIRATASWYDSRANQPHRAAEWRLYYPAPAGQIQSKMAVGDLMVIAVTPRGHLLILLAKAGSGREQQLRMLFQLPISDAAKLSVRTFEDGQPLDFLSASVLEDLGIAKVGEPQGDGSDLVRAMSEELVDDHPEALPPGAAISAFVRLRVPNVDKIGDPDGALLKWMEIETAVYRAWEDRKIERRVEKGFIRADGSVDVDGFRTFTMFLRQSRVSRAGGALQYHFRELLDARKVRYVMEPKVDGGEIPDFIFPGVVEYNDPGFAPSRLRMLAAKHTAKDRWRQVLNEAARIWPKHLLTMDPGISGNQIDLMIAGRLHLVMPSGVRARYPDDQAKRISAVSDFIEEVKLL